MSFRQRNNSQNSQVWPYKRSLAQQQTEEERIELYRPQPKQIQSLYPRHPAIFEHETIEGQATDTLSYLREVVATWESDCAFCHVLGLRPAQQRHQLRKCSERGACQVREQIQEIMGSFNTRVSPNSCGDCLLPKAICRRYRASRNGWEESGMSSCQLPIAVLPVGLAVLMSINPTAKILLKMVVLPEMQEAGVDIERKDQVLGWMLQERQWGGIKSTNVTWIFHRFHMYQNESEAKEKEGQGESEEEEELEDYRERGSYKRRRTHVNSRGVGPDVRDWDKFSVDDILYCQFHCPGCPIGEHD
ncbi:DNA helicase recq [Penicillium verhagenii]|uniref:DNA helicase recq n=1 Tax=Penicillium verhagenii TaxID=1562060 RepID=UPI002545568E|nr:DNA helicase recq [Penicillium verhagenii]KAJ5935176.1 DNA helicase recq [Penicillium verhagenii]